MRKRKADRDGIYKPKGTTRYHASYQDASGRRVRRSTGKDNLAQAKAIRTAWIAAEERKGPPGQAHTLHDLIMAYVTGHSHLKSLERAEYATRNLYRLLGPDRDIATIKAADITAYQQTRLGAGAQPATINREVGLLSAAYNYAARALGWEIKNPTQGRKLREPAGRQRWLSPVEEQRLIAAARDERLVDYIRLAIYAGLRNGEILGLEWRRVDLQQARILLEAEHQKSGKVGAVPLNQTALTAIRSRARFRAENCPASPWVFCHRDGRRLGSVKKGFAAAVERSGIEKCHPHDLRRTFGSRLANAGAPIQQIAELMRHSDVRITARIYAHLQPDRLRETVDILDSIEQQRKRGNG